MSGVAQTIRAIQNESQTQTICMTSYSMTESKSFDLDQLEEKSTSSEACSTSSTEAGKTIVRRSTRLSNKAESSYSLSSVTVSQQIRPICKYGPTCYRKNPKHFEQFSHPWLTQEKSTVKINAN